MLILKSFFRESRSADVELVHTSYFHYAFRFITQLLAYMIDSLVRVSRRDEEEDFVWRGQGERLLRFLYLFYTK